MTLPLNFKVSVTLRLSTLETMTEKELLHSAKIRVRDAERNAKKRKGDRSEFNLTAEDVVAMFKRQNGQCVVTGITFTHVFKGKERDKTNPWTAFSIDRIDNSQGYTRDNIRLVTNALNIARRDREIGLANAHYSEFLEVMRGVLCPS